MRKLIGTLEGTDVWVDDACPPNTVYFIPPGLVSQLWDMSAVDAIGKIKERASECGMLTNVKP